MPQHREEPGCLGNNQALLFSGCVIVTVQIASEDLSFLICEMGKFGFSKWDASTQFKIVPPLSPLLSPLTLSTFGSMFFKSRANHSIWQKAVSQKYCLMNECMDEWMLIIRATKYGWALPNSRAKGHLSSWRLWWEIVTQELCDMVACSQGTSISWPEIAKNNVRLLIGVFSFMPLCLISFSRSCRATTWALHPSHLAESLVLRTFWLAAAMGLHDLLRTSSWTSWSAADT